MDIAERTIPETINHLAEHSPDRIWARFPKSSAAFKNAELETVTYRTLAAAINKLARHLDSVLGRNEQDKLERICYIGPSDIRYFILACAASNTRRTAVFTSPRNSLEAHLAILDKTECSVLFSGHEDLTASATADILKARPLRAELLPTLDQLLDVHQDEDVECERIKSFTDASHEPFVILHTTGTTGLPKPVSNTHGLISTIDAQQLLSDVDGRSVGAKHWIGKTVYTALPPFHSAGINCFAFSIFLGAELIFGPADQPPSLDTVDVVLSSGLANAGIMAPSLLTEVANDEAVLPKLSQWSFVAFGGSAMSAEAGNAIWRYTTIITILGSTETFNLPELPARRVDEWEYHCYHPSLGIEFRPHSQDLHELVFVRNQSSIRHQGAFWTFPDQQECSMKDLYEPHPSEPNLWRYRGRIDDIIILANGEKFNPVTAEQLIAENEAVKSALIIGSTKQQAAVLIEPQSERDAQSPVRRASIVEAVEQANEVLPAHAQIQDSLICVLDDPHAFLRSSKGQVRRAPTAAALGDEIERLYAAAEQDQGGTYDLDFSSEGSLCKSLQDLVTARYSGGKHVSVDVDLFQCGFDSLRVLQLMRLINSSLHQQDKSPTKPITTRTIYQCSTIQALSQHLMHTFKGGDEEDEEEDFKQMQSLLDDYTEKIDQIALREKPSRHLNPRHQDKVVLLTGSTGSLGSYILDSLVRDPSIQSIICLNRPGSSHHKQTQINTTRGLTTDFHKVSFLETDTSKPHLGLSHSQHHSLATTLTHIIHNAWPVNFNLPLPAFVPQLDTCLHLIHLAHLSPRLISTLFLSSIGAANHYAQTFGPDVPVPEHVLTDFRVVEKGMGYAQSKHLAERLFEYASKRLEMQQQRQRMGSGVTIARCGQICGPVKEDRDGEEGEWNRDEWFPSIMRSCGELGCVPRDLGGMERVDWIPVDVLGGMLARYATAGERGDDATENEQQQGTGARFLHLVNPNVTRWGELVEGVVIDAFGRAEAEGGKTLEVVDFEEWLSRLEVESRDEEKAKVLPAAKLLEFMQEIGSDCAKRPVFSTRATELVLPELKEVGQVNVAWVTRWMRQWGIFGSEI